MFDSRYLRQPIEVALETLALCNARCTFCPYPTLERKGAEMSDALLDRVIREMASWEAPFYVSPFKVNEPFLDSRLGTICKAIEETCPHATLRLFTNGTALTPDKVSWVAKLRRLEHLWISLNEVDEKAYEQTMGLPLRLALKRLDHLHSSLTMGAFRHPVVVSRVSDGNGIIQTALDTHFIRVVQSRYPLFKTHLIKRDGWLGYVTPGSSEIPKAPCGRWFELNLIATGHAALCCMDGTGEYGIGDANKNALLDIYNQPYLIARRTHAANRDGIEPCQRCTY